MAAGPGRVWLPHLPLWLTSCLLVARPSAAPMLASSPARLRTSRKSHQGGNFWKSDQSPGLVLAARLRPNLEAACGSLSVFSAVIVNGSRGPGSVPHRVIAAAGCGLCFVTLVAMVPGS